MLVLSRKLGEEIVIGEGANEIRLVVVDIDHGKVRLGITAPRTVPIVRQELLPEAKTNTPTTGTQQKAKSA